ncbi:MAG: hypothetical protein AAF824_00365 [Bacteroidota bacterium]
MNKEILIVLLSGGISLLASYLTYEVKERRKRRLAKSSQREQILDKYREFISSSAYDLQSRVYNIVVKGFLKRWGKGDNEVYRHNAIYYTLFLFGQFFCWREIFRKELRFLTFKEGKEEINLLEHLTNLEGTFSKSGTGDDNFMVFRGNQRAIGESMIKVNPASKSLESIGFAAFIEKYQEKAFQRWFINLEQSIRRCMEIEEDEGIHFLRLTEIQRHLIDLIDELDPNYIRFKKFRSKIPLPPKG